MLQIVQGYLYTGCRLLPQSKRYVSLYIFLRPEFVFYEFGLCFSLTNLKGFSAAVYAADCDHAATDYARPPLIADCRLLPPIEKVIVVAYTLKHVDIHYLQSDTYNCSHLLTSSPLLLSRLLMVVFNSIQLLLIIRIHL